MPLRRFHLVICFAGTVGLLSFGLTRAASPSESSSVKSVTAESNGDGSSGSELDENAKSDTWDIETPSGKASVQTIDVTEGTWMNLDVSPDGKQIVFDLLGDLYTIPVDGEQPRTPTKLTSGIGWDMQPRYSPDGSWIAFTSDRMGKNKRAGDNLWIMRADGSDVRQVSNETFRLLNGPAWSPDGDYLIGRKHFTSRRSLGSGEIWMYHRAAKSAEAMAGIQLTQKPNEQKDVNEPVYSPDGKYIYYSQDTTPGNTFEYDKDSHGQIYTIKRLNLEDGTTEAFVTGPGGACRPTPSHDGKSLAFVRRVDAKTTLHVLDLQSGAVRLVYDELERDMQEAWAIHGVYPNFAWMPDDQSIIAWAKGKIRRIDIRTGTASVIPFHLVDEREVRDAVRFSVEVAPERFPVKMLRWVSQSPRGDQVVYQALGKIWLKDLPDGQPRRLTTQTDHHEFYPSFSRDGKHLVYSTWNDETLGSIRVAAVDKTGTPEEQQTWTVTKEPGHYLEPTFSPDGKTIVFVKSGDGYLRSPLWSREPGLYKVDAHGGEAERLLDSGHSPQFANDSDRVYFLKSNRGSDADNLRLCSVGLDGDDERDHLKSQWGTTFRVSPDGKWAAFIERFNVYVTPLVNAGKAIDIGPKGSAIPIAKVSEQAGDWCHFSGDSSNLVWALGPTLYRKPLDQAFGFLGEDPADDLVADATSAEATKTSATDNAPTGEPTTSPEQIAIGFETTTAAPETTFAFVGAKIVTMGEQGVINPGTIVIRGNRIEALGPRNEVTIPDEATIIQTPGMVIMPGLVDVHAHGPMSSDGITPQQNWVNYARLAFGVTTVHDPSNDTGGTFSAIEMIRAGETLGPRTFSTGTILYGAAGSFKAEIESLEDAKFHLRRMKAAGAFSVKSYNQPRRDQRQQVLAAARELEMMVVPEGGSTFMHNMTMIVDGHTGIEHTLPVQTAYDDVFDLWRGTNVGYTPTLCVAYGGISGERYWYEVDDLWRHPRLNSFLPPHKLHQTHRRQKAPLEDYNHIRVAEIAKQVVRDGGLVQAGGHGQLNGIDTHWELWSFVQGGMTPIESLRCGTINGAKYLGLDDDIGSLEVGKLADLVVIERGFDPTEEIRHSEKVELVMINGRLFRAETMQEIGGQQQPAPKFFFSNGQTMVAPIMSQMRGCECSRPGGLPDWMIRSDR